MQGTISVNQMFETLGWMMAGAIIMMFLFLVGMTWYINYRGHSKTILRVYDPGTEYERDYLVIPDIGGAAYVGDRMPGKDGVIMDVPYMLDTAVTDLRVQWPGTFWPSFMQKDLSVSLHIRGKSPAVSYVDMAKTLQSIEATAIAMESARHDNSLATLLIAARSRLSGFKQKFLCPTNLLIMGGILVMVVTLYYVYELKTDVGALIKASGVALK